jgi:hypothetical protein
MLIEIRKIKAANIKPCLLHSFKNPYGFLKEFTFSQMYYLSNTTFS